MFGRPVSWPEPVGEPGKAVLFPHVDDARPAVRGADDAPHAEAQLVALFLRDRAPVGRHVMHVLRTLGPADVDELVRVDLVVHPRTVAPLIDQRWMRRRESSTRSRPGFVPSQRAVRQFRSSGSSAARPPSRRSRAPARAPDRAASSRMPTPMSRAISSTVVRVTPGQDPAVERRGDEAAVDDADHVGPGGFQQPRRRRRG